jgi:hypothetical protein
MYGNRMPEAVESFPEKSKRYQKQQNRVGEGRENAGTAITVRPLRICRTLRPMCCEPGEQNGWDVREIMNSIAHECDGMTKVTTEELGGDEHECGE